MNLCSCGNCSNKEFNILTDNEDFPTVFIFECTKCKSTSEVSILPPKMRVSFSDNSNGVICFMGNEKVK